MIISVSRRTDIPACFSPWFFNRLNAGEAYYLNPFNAKQAHRVSLKKEDVTAFVFWTKDPRPMLPNLDRLHGYNYYFHVTITPYHDDLEPTVGKNKGDIIESFKVLSERLGKHRVIWRYDPIIVNKRYTVDFHKKAFSSLAEQLAGYTEQCIVSFVDLYKTAKKNKAQHGLQELSKDTIHALMAPFSSIAKGCGLKLQSCSENIDLSQYGIEHARCVDDELIERLVGHRSFNGQKDPNQRGACGCVQSVDLGAYNSCQHRCVYCYANFSEPSINKNLSKHHPKSKVLLGELPKDAKIFDVVDKCANRDLFNMN